MPGILLARKGFESLDRQTTRPVAPDGDRRPAAFGTGGVQVADREADAGTARAGR